MQKKALRVPPSTLRSSRKVSTLEGAETRSIRHGLFDSVPLLAGSISLSVLHLEMDPLTIITTAASIVGTAIKLSKTLYDTIETLKDAPADVRALCTTIDSVKSAVSRLVGFMNDGQQCQWPDEWLEDVMNDIEAISGELKEVQRLIDSWNGQDTGGRMKDAWRNWKWHFNSEETQRCTRRLREAKEDLGFQISVIQLWVNPNSAVNILR